MMLRSRALTAALLVLLVTRQSQALEEEEDGGGEEGSGGEETSTISSLSSAATTLGTLFRQARSDYYAASSRYRDSGRDEDAPIARADPLLEHRDASYYESRCITCDPSKAAQTVAAAQTAADRDPYSSRWRQRGKYDYDDDLEERRYRDRYDYYGRNDAYRPTMYNDRYDPYERDRYSPRPVDRPYMMDRPLIERPIVDRPLERPIDRPLMERPYDRSYDRTGSYGNLDSRYPYDDRYDHYGPSRRPPPPPSTAYDEYERGNGYDNLDARYPYDDRYDRYGPASPRRPPPPPYDDYGSSRYDRYNGRNYGRYDPYERNGYRRPVYDDRYDRYGGAVGGRGYPPDHRTYYGVGVSDGAGGWSAHAGGGADRPAYASAWNYSGGGGGGGGRDSWRDINRDRDRDRDRERDRDAGFYRPRDYFYDSTAAPGGSRGTSYLYDRPESSTKPDADQRDKPTSSPQTQDTGKTYKD